MSEVYQETALTPLRVASSSGYRDWSWQPSMFKRYPNFLFRYKYEERPLLRIVELCRIVTSRFNSANQPYLQLNTPSAGNLHPVELYVQIRAMKGIISGIYHVDAGKSELVLIAEIESDGMESFVGLEKRWNGFIFLLSTVAFRSEWKYGARAFRYCYLDLGHQVGAINAALKLYEQEMTILSDFDVDLLHTFMGFGQDEFVGAVICSGEMSQKSVQTPKKNLMYVAASDYSELSPYTQKLLAKSEILKSDILEVEGKFKEEQILQRRSARAFDEASMSQEKWDYFMGLLSRTNHPVSCYTIVLKEGVYKAGIYLNHKLLQEGNFAQEIASLLVAQNFVKNADIVSVFCSKYFSSNKLMQAGAFVHSLSLQAEANAVGCSGIGAFYDKKLQDFLGTQEYILYVCALGEKKKEEVK
jgi:SagB-type dehydrogenase family enzyme